MYTALSKFEEIHTKDKRPVTYANLRTGDAICDVPYEVFGL